MIEWIAAYMTLFPGTRFEEVMEMDALMSMALMSERAKRVAVARSQTVLDGQTVHHADGRATRNISSVESLMSFMRGPQSGAIR